MFRYFLPSTKVLLVLKKYKRVDQRGSTSTPRRKQKHVENKKEITRVRRAQKNIEREAAAQQVQDLTKELADCKKQLVDSEASKAQLENKLSELKQVLSEVQHKPNEEIRLGTQQAPRRPRKKKLQLKSARGCKHKLWLQ